MDMVCRIAGMRLRKCHDLSKPQGVRRRSSDNSRLRQVLGWEPSIPLERGLEGAYHWIESQVREEAQVRAVAVT